MLSSVTELLYCEEGVQGQWLALSLPSCTWDAMKSAGRSNSSDKLIRHFLGSQGIIHQERTIHEAVLLNLITLFQASVYKQPAYTLY